MNHERLIQGDGTPDSAWQAWLASGQIALGSMASFLNPNVRLVVIAPHPDDEVLACGGLMAMHLAQAGDICVIAVTDGEASHVASPLRHGHSLAATRCAERLAGLHQLGLKDSAVTRLALPDGLVAQHTLRLSSQLQRLLRPADVVVTTWRLDGHPDHDATGLAASWACCAVGCCLIEAPVWMWHWATPAHLLVPWQRLQRFELTLQACDRKQAALSQHVSQLDESRQANGAVLGKAIVQRAQRPVEYFFTSEVQPHEAHS